MVRLADIRARGIVELFRGANFDVGLDRLKATMREAEDEANNIRFGQNLEVPSKTVVYEILEKLGIEETGELFDNAWRIYTDSLLTINIELKPGAGEALRQLKTNGYRLGLVSNTAYGEKLRTILKNFGLARYFDCMLFSDEFGLRKPRPEIFRAALAEVKTDARQAVHVGDRVDLDVLGAKNAGMFAIYLDADRAPYPEGFPRPDITVHSLAEVPAAVQEISLMQSAK